LAAKAYCSYGKPWPGFSYFAKALPIQPQPVLAVQNLRLHLAPSDGGIKLEKLAFPGTIRYSRVEHARKNKFRVSIFKGTLVQSFRGFLSADFKKARQVPLLEICDHVLESVD
jgi:hypothetical protein